MILSGTPAELIEFLLRLFGLRASRATRLRVVLFSKGPPMDSLTLAPGGSALATATGVDDAGNDQPLAGPVSWQPVTGVDGVSATPSADGSSCTFVFPAGVTSGTATITATAPGADGNTLTGTATVTISGGPGVATKLRIDVALAP